MYLLSDYAIKLFVEGGLEQSMYGLGTEASKLLTISLICYNYNSLFSFVQLEFYDILSRADSPLKSHIPNVFATGILFLEKGSYKVVPWDGKRIPEIISTSNIDFDASMLNNEFPFGIWSKKLLEHRNQGMPAQDSLSSLSSQVWPYIITKRCKGKIFAQMSVKSSLFLIFKNKYMSKLEAVFLQKR